MGSRKIVKLLAGSFCSILVLALPFMQLTCGGDAPPTIGTAILRKDVIPNGIRWAVWGAEGYVEGEAYCTDIDGNWNNAIVVPSEVYYFIGGGDPVKPKLELIIMCPFHHAFILDGSAWSWD